MQSLLSCITSMWQTLYLSPSTVHLQQIYYGRDHLRLSQSLLYTCRSTIGWIYAVQKFPRPYFFFFIDLYLTDGWAPLPVFQAWRAGKFTTVATCSEMTASWRQRCNSVPMIMSSLDGPTTMLVSVHVSFFSLSFPF